MLGRLKLGNSAVTLGSVPPPALLWPPLRTLAVSLSEPIVCCRIGLQGRDSGAYSIVLFIPVALPSSGAPFSDRWDHLCQRLSLDLRSLNRLVVGVSSSPCSASRSPIQSSAPRLEVEVDLWGQSQNVRVRRAVCPVVMSRPATPFTVIIGARSDLGRRLEGEPDDRQGSN